MPIFGWKRNECPRFESVAESGDKREDWQNSLIVNLSYQELSQERMQIQINLVFNRKFE